MLENQKKSSLPHGSENFFAQKDHEDKSENQIPMCKKQGLHCSNNSCIKLCCIEPAYDYSNNGKMQRFGHWAVEMFNEEKNAELQCVRVVSGSKLWLEYFFFYLTLEAAEAGVMKIYQAELFLPVLPGNKKIKHPNSWLNLFGHVDNNGTLSILIDKRHEECKKEILESEDINIFTAVQQGNFLQHTALQQGIIGPFTVVCKMSSLEETPPIVNWDQKKPSLNIAGSLMVPALDEKHKHISDEYEKEDDSKPIHAHTCSAVEEGFCIHITDVTKRPCGTCAHLYNVGPDNKKRCSCILCHWEEEQDGNANSPPSGYWWWPSDSEFSPDIDDFHQASVLWM